MDTGDVGPAKLEELATEAKVDTRWLYLQVGVVEGLDDEVTGLEPIEYVRVREDHQPVSRIDGP